MASFRLTVAKFRGGKYNIPDSGSNLSSVSANIQKMIARYEKQYLYELLGVVLGDLIIAYDTANRLPDNPHYNKIIDPFSEDVMGCGIMQSQGIEEYLKAAIYYEYVHNGLVLSQAGAVNVDAETAIKATPAQTMRFADKMFNDVLDTVAAVGWYCNRNSSAFPDYNGKNVLDLLKHSQ